MKKCFLNKKQYEKQMCKKNSETENIARTHEEIKQNMRTEMSSENPSIYSLKKDLEACRSKRQEDARKASSATKHLEDYPALKKPELLLFEFESLIGLKKTEIKDNWKFALPSLKSFFLPELKDDDSINDDQLTTKILQKVTDRFKTKKASACDTSQIVQIFDADTPVSSTEPKVDEPPRMIAIGSNDLLNLKFTTYADGIPMFTGTAIEALIQLFALYWVFHIDYSNKARIPFTFVSAILFRKKVAKYYQKYKTVWNVLEELNLF